MRPHSAFFLLVLATVCLSGCTHHSDAVSSTAAKTNSPKKVTPILVSMPVDLKKVQPKEAGLVPILEYHDLVTTNKTKGYEYPAASFRKDLEWLYAHDYRPINLSDYVRGKVDVPAGMSPVILTFDDALRGQFYYLSDRKIDPNSAVGVLGDFHAKHADWPLKGTFFVLTDGDAHLPPAFYQKSSEKEKMEYLVKAGYEIGNHTVHHYAGIKHWPDARVMAEFANATVNIQKLLPGYDVDTLALPYGVFPKNKKLVIRGESGGVKYHNICALLAGANPAPSPMSQKFKPYYLPRMIPGPGNFTIRWWLTKMERDKTKFVSDGDPNTYTIPASEKARLSVVRLHNFHLLLRTYSGTQMVASK